MNFRLRYCLGSFRRSHCQARSLMAVMCLGLGIATLMQVLALEAGIRERMLAILADTGNRNLTVTPGDVLALPNRGSGVAMAITLTLADYAGIGQVAREAGGRAAFSSGVRLVEAGALDTPATVTGATPGYFALRNYALAQGRFTDALDELAQEQVAVLGARAAAVLFGAEQTRVLAEGEIPGRGLTIGGVPFTVIGVLRARGSGQTGMSEDDGVFIPLSTALRRVFNIDYLDGVIVEAADIDAIPPLRDTLTLLLRGNHGLAPGAAEDFLLLDATRTVMAARDNQRFTRALFRGVALLAVAMGGAGILAVNLLGVKEREGEFGLRKAVGARVRDIVLLVLGETMALGVVGALGGLGFGLGVYYALRTLTDWTLRIDWLVLTQALGAALLLSMLAALLPAWQAGMKQPIGALRGF